MRRAFPREVGSALRGDRQLDNGLHNWGARITRRSPEVAGLPMTPIGVPVLHRMSEAQKAAFYELLHRPFVPPSTKSLG